MLGKLEQTKARLGGIHKALDAFLNARQSLLVEYIRLSTHQKTLPAQEELHEFCGQLVDYVSAGHFEVYDHVLAAYEASKGNARVLAERIYPRIKRNTDDALNFHDKYTEADDDTLLELDQDLSRLGELLEERFELEDRLVSAIRLTDHLDTGEPA
ncbi:sigma D regulator [Oceanimonas sp. NS1]|uniref:Rsd/AlgQ family anti-sigma factor n=1 Tax=Oceanimonas doudoroffii TaxID=84158 RepID=A0A233RB80_9GAMM|nr:MULTISPECIES: sigma D regulator [Oceanimonas]MCT7655056.1 sigma D regulator [Oceanimonas sp. NS1]NHH99619.1 Regulator of sigma D [Oceanimonas sp. MB9]OXY80650.1 Rsd/AlgQ family anti-sigma factor [Oceanimonas doudoroffii]